MKNLSRVVFIVIVLLVVTFLGYNRVLASSLGNALWAKTPTTAPNQSYFLGSTTDVSGNVYAVGYITGNGEYNFGSGVTVSGPYDGVGLGHNALIVKYASDGTPQWAKSATAAVQSSDFNNVGLDQDGNIYVTGFLTQDDEFSFGNGVTVSGNAGATANALIIKYNSSGLAQWAKSTTVAPSGSSFLGSWVDPSNNVYTAGYIKGNAQYNFGNSVTVTGNLALNENALIVKYNSSGVPQWAKSTTTAPNKSTFETVKGDLSGNIYVAGFIKGSGTYNFADSVTVSGNNTGNNAAIFKYSSDGSTQWAKSTTTAPGASDINSIAVDTVGNSIAVGYIAGNGTFNFGNSVTVAGNSTGQNALVLKYDSSGNAQWAKSVESAPAGEFTEFNDVVYSSTCGIYAVGYNGALGQYDFGNGVSVTSPNEFSNNLIIVEYDTDGLPLWAKTTSAAPDFTTSFYQDVTADGSENIYVAGGIETTDAYTFGTDPVVTVNGGDAGLNAVLVKYSSAATTTCPAGTSSHPEFINLPGDSRPINLDEGGIISDPLYTLEVKPSGKGIAQVDFFVDDNLICTDKTADANGVYSCDWDTTKYHSDIKIVTTYLNGKKITLTRTVEVKSATDQLTILPKTGKDIFQPISINSSILSFFDSIVNR